MRYNEVVRLLALAAVAAALAAPAGAAGPRLSVADDTPFTVRGAGFVAREHVRVVVTANGSATRWATASAGGAFTLRFPTVRLGACAAYAVRAYGSHGSRAVIRIRPECAPGPVDQ
jgi:hypothetical protein